MMTLDGSWPSTITGVDETTCRYSAVFTTYISSPVFAIRSLSIDHTMAPSWERSEVQHLLLTGTTVWKSLFRTSPSARKLQFIVSVHTQHYLTWTWVDLICSFVNRSMVDNQKDIMEIEMKNLGNYWSWASTMWPRLHVLVAIWHCA
jgi:hypothetical protein